MNWRRITKYFIVIALVIIALFDVFVWQVGGKESTISSVIAEWNCKRPWITFAVGFVMGHMFWSNGYPDDDRFK